MEYCACVIIASCSFSSTDAGIGSKDLNSASAIQSCDPAISVNLLHRHQLPDRFFLPLVSDLSLGLDLTISMPDQHKSDKHERGINMAKPRPKLKMLATVYSKLATARQIAMVHSAGNCCWWIKITEIAGLQDCMAGAGGFQAWIYFGTAPLCFLKALLAFAARA